MKSLITATAICALLAIPAWAGAQDDCSLGTPAFDGYCGVGAGVPGPAGPQGPAGAPGANGLDGQSGAQGPQGSSGADGADGRDGRNGRDGSDADASAAAALAVALGAPIWLEAGEKFALSPSIGIVEGDQSLGLSAVARIDQGVSAYGALGMTVDGDQWGGRLGVRFGFK